jgi:hypothetical protein
VCRTCRITLNDGVEYQWCPRCNGEVDWIDHRYHVWFCPPCDLVVNQRIAPDACPNCSEALSHIAGPIATSAIPPKRPLVSAMRTLGLALLFVQAVFALLDPDAFPYLGPLLVFAQLAGVVVIAATLYGSREFRAIAADRSTRVVHGLEHATANVLEERGVAVQSGVTTTGMFILELEHDGKLYEHLETTVGDAAADAISRIRFGEHGLAYHRRCGTSLLVAMALLAFAIVAAGVVGLVLGWPSGLVYALSVGAGFAVMAVRDRAGLLAQRLLTVSTSFSSAIVTRVDKRISADGNTLTAIVMIDVIPRAVEVDAVAPIPM